MRVLPLVLLALALAACEEKDDTGAEPPPVDQDGDGWGADDCDDDDPAIHPGADEVCNGVDEDCDGQVDEEAVDAPTWHADADEDGYGDPALALTACEAPSGYVEDATDCDDARDDVHPDAPEDDCADPTDYNCDGSVMYADADEDGVAACEDCDDEDPDRSPLLPEVCDADGVDEDCDGLADDQDDDVEGQAIWFTDADEDGFGDPATAQAACDASADQVADGEDCDDSDGNTYPGAAPHDSASACMRDADGDGWGDDEAPPDGRAGSDCDDARAAVNPDATETCLTAWDDDCDGVADAVDATGCATWYYDGDRDGYGLATSTQCTCAASGSYDATDASDCDDTRAAVNPGATESCVTTYDDDCDGLTDEVGAADCATWYYDGDGDYYGLSSASTCRCAAAGSYTTSLGGDCDDTRAAVNPGTAENCATTYDDNCDGLTDEGYALGCSTWYWDGDRDGYGLSTSFNCLCAALAPYDTTDSTDCDDARAAVHPGATESCTTVYDDDCDGATDEVGATGCSTWYYDGDGDSYGVSTSSQCRCAASGSYDATVATDCDDARAAVNPGAREACTTAYDDDCDGATDEVGATGCSAWYYDGDRDGYGLATSSQCRCAASGSYDATAATDCDDARAAVNPGAREACTTTWDDDCDGATDEVGATGCSTWYYDGDRDGYGLATSSHCTCLSSGSFDVLVATDCDDTYDTVNPDAEEVCDGLDNDCDLSVDPGCPTYGYSGDYQAEVSTGSTDADAMIYAGTTNDYFGRSLAVGYDFTGDGSADLSVAAYGTTYGSSYQGGLFRYDGFPAGTTLGTSSYDGLVYGPNTGGTFPLDLWGVEDFDADGCDEIAVYYRDSSSNHYIYLYEGSSVIGARMWSTAAFGGTALSGTGPVVGLGEASVTAGVHPFAIANTTYSSSAGYVRLFEAGASSASSTWALYGESASDLAGGGLAGGLGNDVNGDGYDDIFIGAEGDDDTTSNSGAVYVVESPVGSSYSLAYAQLKILGAGNGDNFGARVVAPGDVDGDGYADLLAAAPYDDDGVSEGGVLFLFTDVNPDGASPDTAVTDAAVKVIGEGSYDRLGLNPTDMGDLNGDGELDLVIGAAQSSVGGAGNAGAVWLLYGPHAGTYDLADSADYDARFLGNEIGDNCGYALGLGDYDADGQDDLVVGCTDGDSGGFHDVGTVYLFLGM